MSGSQPLEKTTMTISCADWCKKLNQTEKHCTTHRHICSGQTATGSTAQLEAWKPVLRMKASFKHQHKQLGPGSAAGSWCCFSLSLSPTCTPLNTKWVSASQTWQILTLPRLYKQKGDQSNTLTSSLMGHLTGGFYCSHSNTKVKNSKKLTVWPVKTKLLLLYSL